MSKLEELLKAKTYTLPVNYEELNSQERRIVRNQYVREQNNICCYCGGSLAEDAPKIIKEKIIDWDLFPPHFLKYPIHLQHNHETGMTEGAVHSYCNAVMWQYEGR